MIFLEIMSFGRLNLLLALIYHLLNILFNTIKFVKLFNYLWAKPTLNRTSKRTFPFPPYISWLFCKIASVDLLKFIFILMLPAFSFWIATPRNAQTSMPMENWFFLYVTTVAFNAKHKKTHFTMKCNPLLWKKLHLHWKFYLHFLFLCDISIVCMLRYIYIYVVQS